MTTDQESAYAVAVQQASMHGPPMYYTTEWDKAGMSVTRLAALEPELVVTGHGQPMRGQPMRGRHMRRALHQLASEFDKVAVPRAGKYLGRPARAEDGSAYCKP